MLYGLNNTDIRKIHGVFSGYPELKQAVLYGSRALGTQRKGSDIDLTLTGKKLTLSVLNRIESDLDDLLLPYQFDLSIYRQIENDSLRNHIERVGKVFYRGGDEGHSSHESHSSHRGEAAVGGAKNGRDGKNELPDGWEVRTLGEVCEILDKLRKPITKKNRIAGPYPYYGATGVLDSVEGYLFDEPLVLIGEDGAKWGAGENSAFAISSKCWVNKHAHVLRPQRSVIIDPWMIAYLNFADLADYISGMTVPKLNQGKLREITIPLPPLPEQERIVAILDEAFEWIETATAHAERNLHNARELFQSVLQSTFEQKGDDWRETRVGDIADHCLGKMLDKRKNRGTLQPYLRNKSVRWFDFDLDDVTEMKFENDEVDRYTAKRGDVLICEGGYPGRAAIWESDDSIFFQKAVHRVRFHEPVFNKWLVYLLYHRDSTGELKDHFTGAGIQHFTGKALADFPIPVGPASSVKSLVQKLDALSTETRRLESIYQRKLDALSELKQSLLQRAFAGEL